MSKEISRNSKVRQVPSNPELTLNTALDSSNRPGEEESIKYTMPSIIGKYVFQIVLPIVNLSDRGNNVE